MNEYIKSEKLERFIQDKKSLALDFKVKANDYQDVGDWMFQLGKEVAFKQVLAEIERLNNND
jgi:hypothetical protein